MVKREWRFQLFCFFNDLERCDHVLAVNQFHQFKVIFRDSSPAGNIALSG